MSLVTSEWLNKNLSKVKIIDASWHMPSSNRNAYNEYKKEHIKNAIFFDLDKSSNQNTELPHMLNDINSWESIVAEMGISNKDEIVIYDNSDLISSCRCWYNFIYFGHDLKKIHVLNGGLKNWIITKKLTTNKINKINKANYKAKELKHLVKNKNQINENIYNFKFEVLDARSRKRFKGIEPEPRAKLRSGSIKNSKCLPFSECINKIDHTFKKKKEIKILFNTILNNINQKNVIFTCGSGVTAAVLAFAYSLINKDYLPIIYDGSWSEYGRNN